MDFSSYYHQKIHTLNCIIHNLNNQITQLNLQLQTERLEKDWYKSNPTNSIQKGEIETQTNLIYLCETLSQTEETENHTVQQFLQENLLQIKHPILHDVSIQTENSILHDICVETDQSILLDACVETDQSILQDVCVETEQLSLQQFSIKHASIQTILIETETTTTQSEILTSDDSQEEPIFSEQQENIQITKKKRQNKSRAFSKVQSKN